MSKRFFNGFQIISWLVFQTLILTLKVIIIKMLPQELMSIHSYYSVLLKSTASVRDNHGLIKPTELGTIA